jgi:hypothetical protein
MTLAAVNLARAREAVEAILDELRISLGLQAYLFEVEFHGDQWKIEVECASEEGWKTVTLEADWDRLLESRNDSKVRHVLLKSWRGRFSGGKLQAFLSSCIFSAVRSDALVREIGGRASRGQASSNLSGT